MHHYKNKKIMKKKKSITEPNPILHAFWCSLLKCAADEKEDQKKALRYHTS